MIKKTNLILSFCLVIFLFAMQIANAQPSLRDAFGNDSSPGPLGQVAAGAGYERVDNSNNIEATIGKIIQTFLSVLGIIFLILTIYAGYTWMTAQGNEAKVDKAKNTLTTAIIGLIIVLAAYALSYFVISSLGEGTLTSQ